MIRGGRGQAETPSHPSLMIGGWVITYPPERLGRLSMCIRVCVYVCVRGGQAKGTRRRGSDPSVLSDTHMHTDRGGTRRRVFGSARTHVHAEGDDEADDAPEDAVDVGHFVEPLLPEGGEPGEGGGGGGGREGGGWVFIREKRDGTHTPMPTRGRGMIIRGR